ncbi:muramidase, partial [Mesorhizobium sp. M7A.F.Ca.MR.362.00.0.0]
RRPSFGIVQYVAWKRTERRSPAQLDSAFAVSDPLSTASTELDRGQR